MVAVSVGVDFAFFQKPTRLMVNVGIVLVFGAFQAFMTVTEVIVQLLFK
jgi:hypothetical protein